MAAAGGDTVVPTNWGGLIMTALAVALVAAATYFGMGMLYGDSNEAGSSKQETSLQDLYSSNAQRGIAAMETVRALPRSVLAPLESLPPPVPAGDGTDSDAETESEDVAEVEAVEPEPQPEPEPEPVVAAATPAPAPTAKPVPQLRIGEEYFIGDTRYRVDAAALHAWWSANDQGNGGLKVVFVGPVDSSVAKHGLAVLFATAVDPAAAKPHIQLTDIKGNNADVTWVSGSNPNLIYTRELPVGRYGVQIGEGLPARNGQTLGQNLRGVSFVN